MPGPAKKPPALRALEGNRGKRPIRDDYPKPDATPPVMPAWLDVEAKSEWRRVCPELHKLGLLTKVDRASLAGYCAAYSRWVRAESVITTDGFTYDYSIVGKDGKVIQLKTDVRPEVKIAQDSLKQVRMFCAEFGLTPSSRGKMQVPGLPPARDEMERLLDGEVGPTVRQAKN